MDLTSKRKMVEVIRGVIGPGYSGSQEDLRELLQERGFHVTQSTISRALKKIGAIKVGLEDGGGQYELRKNGPMKAYGGSLKDLVLSTLANETMIVIKTVPGSAMFVAGFLDHYCQDSILGTVAGDDTIFCVPPSIKKIKLYLAVIENYILKH